MLFRAGFLSFFFFTITNVIFFHLSFSVAFHLSTHYYPFLSLSYHHLFISSSRYSFLNNDRNLFFNNICILKFYIFSFFNCLLYCIAPTLRNHPSHYFLLFTKSKKSCYYIISLRISAGMKKPIISHSNPD